MPVSYRNILTALMAVGAAGLSSALAEKADAKAVEGNTAPTEASPVAQRLQDIRDAVSALAPAGVPLQGAHGSIDDSDIKLAWWANGNGRGWGNGGRRWGNGPGPRWGNGGWHNWGNGGRHWFNF